MSFLEFPWLIASLFMRGAFEPDKGPNEGRPLVRGRVVAALVLSVMIILATLLIGETLRRLGCAAYSGTICTVAISGH